MHFSLAYDMVAYGLGKPKIDRIAFARSAKSRPPRRYSITVAINPHATANLIQQPGAALSLDVSISHVQIMGIVIILMVAFAGEYVMKLLANRLALWRPTPLLEAH